MGTPYLWFDWDTQDPSSSSLDNLERLVTPARSKNRDVIQVDFFSKSYATVRDLELENVARAASAVVATKLGTGDQSNRLDKIEFSISNVCFF